MSELSERIFLAIAGIGRYICHELQPFFIFTFHT